MEILIVSTSPRKAFSTSKYFSKILKLFLVGHNVEVISLMGVSDYNKILERFANIDTLVFATPVYVDSIPSTTLGYLEKMENHIKKKEYRFNVYAIINCGFYEGKQCQLALKTYELWCQRVGLQFQGGVGIGSGVMLGFIRILPLIGLMISTIEVVLGKLSISFVMQTVLWLLFTLGTLINLFKLSVSINKKRDHRIKFTTVWFCPRLLFVIMASLYWIFRALICYGIMPWELYRKDVKYINKIEV